MEGLSPAARAEFRQAHPEWSIDGETISRTFRFEDFNEAMGFVSRVALAAEAADHHPDIDIRWNRVSLTLTSHDAGALTERDTSLAARCDGFGER